MKLLFTFWLSLFLFASNFSFSQETFEPLPCLNKKFSVIIHIVKDSLGSPGISELNIQNKLDDAAAYFSDICVTFEICEFRYIDNFQYNTLLAGPEWAQLQIDYHEENCINIFFVRQTDIDASFATLGGIGQTTDGGIVLRKSEDAGTYAHEMGHYFGLLHTFEGSGSANAELVDGSNCDTAGDQICDTPADPFILGTSSILYFNPITGDYIYMVTDANGDFYIPNVQNIMSYYPGDCNFTYQQYLRMANTYLTSNPKMW